MKKSSKPKAAKVEVAPLPPVVDHSTTLENCNFYGSPSAEMVAAITALAKAAEANAVAIQHAAELAKGSGAPLLQFGRTP